MSRKKRCSTSLFHAKRRPAARGVTARGREKAVKLLEEDEIKLEKTYKHTIEIVVDRIVVKPGQESRIAEACELAVAQGDGLVSVIGDFYDHHYEKMFSTKLACPDHGISIEELEPRMFSFNAPFGACPTCNGLGFTQKLDPKLLIDETNDYVFARVTNDSLLHTGTATTKSIVAGTKAKIVFFKKNISEGYTRVMTESEDGTIDMVSHSS